MRCEKCHKNEATIHVNEMDAGSPEIQKRHLCETCFRESESDLMKRPDIMKALETLRAHKDNPPA